jgi:hypothetical protein
VYADPEYCIAEYAVPFRSARSEVSWPFDYGITVARRVLAKPGCHAYLTRT